jgi:heme A synthase
MLRNNQQRARMARIIFLLFAITCGSLVLISLAGMNLPDWDGAANGTGSGFTTGIHYGYILLVITYLILLIASYVYLIMWLRRAYYNLHQVPGIHPEYSDGWAAGAWFVPFLNFVRPYTIMREVWQDTQRAAWGRIVEPSTVLGWWWAAFIFKLILGRITTKMGSDSDGVTQENLLPMLLDTGAHLIFAVLTWHIIGRVATFEEELTVRQQVNQLGQPISLPVSHKTDQSDYQLEESY